MITIRPCEDRHYAAVVVITNATQPEPTTAAEMRRSDRMLQAMEGFTLIRVVAELETGEVVGYGFTENASWSPPGEWQLQVAVAPDRRSQGIGLALYQHLKQIPVAAGAVRLDAWVKGEDDDSMAWAERRGFHLERQRTESVLDLAGFDPSRFPGALERVEQSGLLLAAHTEVDDALLRQVWALDNAVSPDVPAWQPDDQLLSFEQYRKMWREDPAERVVACCFDDGRLVGLSTLWMPVASGGGAYTGFTGIDRAYRGRGIGLALKLLTIREAIARGIPHMRTNNDPDNPAMLAVNAKLGYRLVPGPRRMKLPL